MALRKSKVSIQKVRLLIFLVSIGILLYFSKTLISSAQNAQLPAIVLSKTEREELKNGDLIFRKAFGVASDYIVSIDSRSSYSHVGIVHKDGQTVNVIHSSTDSAKTGAFVHEASLDDFLDGVRLAAVYRVQNIDQAIANQAVGHASQMLGLPFDANLDLKSTEAIYCTELVWRAYKESGIDLLGDKFDHLTLPLLGEGDYILPSSLAESRQVVLFKTYRSSPKGN